jgi:hypothetical protein
MLVFASIITQLIEAQANKNSHWRIMHGNYAGFARSVVTVVDFFTRQARAGSRHDGLVLHTTHMAARCVFRLAEGPDT